MIWKPCHFRTALTLIVICMVALIIRVWVTGSIIGFNQIHLHSDDAEFESIGWTLALTGRYAMAPDGPPTAHRSPLMPILLGGVYRLVGHQRAIAQSILIFISTLTVLVTFFLGKEAVSLRVGILAALFIALDPFAWLFAGIFYSETLFTFMFALALLLLFRVMKNPQRINLILLGVVLGACALTRPNGLAIAMGGIILLILAHEGRLNVWMRNAAIVLTVVVIIIIPWIVRNYYVFERFVPTTTQTGEVLLGFYNQTCLKYRCNEWISLKLVSEYQSYPALDNLNELERNDLQISMMVNNVRDNPVEFLYLLPTKVIRFWQHDQFFPNVPNKTYPSASFFVYQKAHYRFIFLLSLAGLFWLYFNGRRQTFIILTSYVAIFSLMVLVLWGDARLRMPLHVLLAVASVYTLTVVYDKFWQWTRLQYTTN